MKKSSFITKISILAAATISIAHAGKEDQKIYEVLNVPVQGETNPEGYKPGVLKEIKVLGILRCEKLSFTEKPEYPANFTCSMKAENNLLTYRRIEEQDYYYLNQEKEQFYLSFNVEEHSENSESKFPKTWTKQVPGLECTKKIEAEAMAPNYSCFYAPTSHRTWKIVFLPMMTDLAIRQLITENHLEFLSVEKINNKVHYQVYGKSRDILKLDGPKKIESSLLWEWIEQAILVCLLRDLRGEMHKKNLSLAASWIEIKADALKNNIQTFRNLTQTSQPSSGLGVVLKGNAYGHGLDQVFPVVHSSIDCCYVIDPTDAYQLRELEKLHSLPEKRILVIGAVQLEEILECTRRKIEIVLSDHEWKNYVDVLRQNHLRAQVHIHLDTGLSREGFFSHELDQLAEWLKPSLGAIEVIGVMSHFANTEDVTDQNYASLQMSNFEQNSSRLEALLTLERPLERHIAASAASLVLARSHFNFIRIGISLFGLWPSSETRLSAKTVYPKLPILQPVLSWKCRSQVIKTVAAGSYVGYGCTYRCSRETRIAVLPVGYFDGYPRMVSGKAHVLVEGKRCPVLGRVMMNHIMIDVSELDPSVTTVEATLIGSSGDETVSAETLAGWAQTIHYEIMARLSPKLKRIVV